MNWTYFCRITTVGKRNEHDVIKSLTPDQLEQLKQSVSKVLAETTERRQEVCQLIDAQLESLMAHHG